MSKEVEALTILIAARTADFERSMASAERRINKAEQSFKASTRGIERDTSRMAQKVNQNFAAMNTQIAASSRVLSATLKGALGGLIGGAVGAFSIEGVTKTIADLAELQDTADKTGVSVKKLQELSFAAEQSGGSMEDVAKGLTKFGVQASEAARGSGELGKILEANGVAAADASGKVRPLGDLLGDVAELIKNASSEADQLTIATAAFGRGAGPGLVIALQGGKQGLADFAKEANDAGIVVGDKLVKRAASLDDQLAKLKRQLDGLGKQLILEFGGAAVAGAFEATLQSLREIAAFVEAIRSGDTGTVAKFLFSGSGLSAGKFSSDEGTRTKAELDELTKTKADIEGRIAEFSKSVGPNSPSNALVANLNKQLKETQDRIAAINAKSIDFTPSRAGFTDGSTPLDEINVQGKPTILPTEGAGGAGDGSGLLGDAIRAYVDRVVKAESGGNANAKNDKSSASGLGGFIDSTFVAQFRKTYASEYSKILAEAGGSEAAAKRTVLQYKTNGDVSRKLIEAYAKENAGALQNAGKAVTEANLHLSHFLGAGGAIKALRADPSANARSVLGDAAAKANPTIIGGNKTIADVLAYADKRANATRIAAGDLTPGEEKSKDAKKTYDDSLKESDTRAAALGRENEALTQNAYQRAFAAEKARLLADIEKEGVTATPEQVAAIDQKSQRYAAEAEAADRAKTATEGLKQAREELASIGAEATKGIVADLKAGASAADALRNALDRVLTRLTDNLIDSLFKGLVGGATGGGGIVSALLGGGKASGGRVSKGQVYPVGENGRELFAPGENGRIIPANMLKPTMASARTAGPARVSSQVQMRVTVSGPMGDKALMQAMEATAKRAGQQAYVRAVATSDRRVESNINRFNRHGQS